VIERAFAALKSRFRILDNKPFHPYSTQVKLVLACCILHNWILRHGLDAHFPPEESWTPNTHNVEATNDVAHDNITWAAQRDAMAAQMWHDRGSTRV